MSRLEFGVHTICRFCGGTGKQKDSPCGACFGNPGILGRAPRTPDENSTAAAESIEPVMGKMNHEVYRLIQEHGPVSTARLEQLTGGLHQTISARVYQLHKDGLIERVGKGVTPSGRPCWLYSVKTDR